MTTIIHSCDNRMSSVGTLGCSFKLVLVVMLDCVTVLVVFVFGCDSGRAPRILVKDLDFGIGIQIQIIRMIHT